MCKGLLVLPLIIDIHVPIITYVTFHVNLREFLLHSAGKLKSIYNFPSITRANKFEFKEFIKIDMTKS